MNVNEILAAILAETGLNQRDFTSRIGVNSNTFSDLRSGKLKNISHKLADKIVAEFPQFSKSWLLTGEGSMLASSVSAPVFQNSGDNVSNHQDSINGELISLLKEKDRQIDRLLSVLEKVSGVAPREGASDGC